MDLELLVTFEEDKDGERARAIDKVNFPEKKEETVEPPKPIPKPEPPKQEPLWPDEDEEKYDIF